MVPYFIFIALLGNFIVFVDYTFSSAFSANYKPKIINENNINRFCGKSHTQYASKYVQLSKATATATSSSADKIDVVILPPDDGQLSEAHLMKIMTLCLQM